MKCGKSLSVVSLNISIGNEHNRKRPLACLKVIIEIACRRRTRARTLTGTRDSRQFRGPSKKEEQTAFRGFSGRAAGMLALAPAPDSEVPRTF